MSYDIEVMLDCASNYGIFLVESSVPGESYRIDWAGSEAGGWCPCKGFQYRQTCKHVKWVWEHGCFYNPQWREGRSNPEAKPVGYTYDAIVPDEKCPACGGPVVAVRRAV